MATFILAKLIIVFNPNTEFSLDSEVVHGSATFSKERSAKIKEK